MLLEDKYFRKISMIGIAWIRKWTPQNAKDKILAQAQSTRLYILLLVIQDHIESIGKPILLKGDEVLLNGLLAQSAL